MANSLYFPHFPNLPESWIIGIFEYFPTLYFTIFTTFQRNWKLGLLNIGKEPSNEQAWMKVGSWILSQFRTANLDVSFHHFRGVNFKISED